MTPQRNIDDPVESFARIARDPAALAAFHAGIGREDAPSRLRAARAFANRKRILDVGCGPAVFFDTLCSQRDRSSFEYVGVEPVLELADLARRRVFGLADSPAGRWLRDRCAIVHDADPAGLLELSTADSGPHFDAVLLRHVLEHLRDPHRLLAAAAAICTGTLVVVLSRETRLAGIPQTLLTDRELGALRYSHYRPALLRQLQALGFVVHERCTHGDGLVVHEEYFELRRPGSAVAPAPADEPAG